MRAETVITTSDGRIAGRHGDGDGVVVFAGVPYAAPPVGARRFRPPGAVAPWTGVRDATAFGAAPPQVPSPGGPALATSEDCLTLNVWTPGVTGRRPVLVWVFGGGFEGGSASPPMFDPARFVRRTGCVVVAPNYRVGALGWLDLASLDADRWPGSVNLGLQDVTAALRWVAANAEQVGGDPSRVTLAGESAGAFCVGAVLAAPAARGLFRRAILQSGSTTRVLPRDRSAAIASDLVSRLATATPDTLADVPVDELLRVQREVVDTDIGRRNTPGGRVWGVVHDGAVLPVDPQAAVRSGGATGVDLLVGANRDEARMWEVLFADGGYAPTSRAALLDEMARCVGPDDAATLLAAYEARGEGGTGLARARTSFLSDWIYRAPAARLATDQRAAGGRAFSYLFAAEPFGPELGAFHASELAFVFDALDRPLGPLAAPGDGEGGRFASVRDEMVAAWGAFAETGDPGWAVHDRDAPSTRCFGGTEPLVRELPPDVTGVFARATFRA